MGGGVIAWNVYRYKVSHLVVEINPLNQAFNITQRHSQRRVKDNMKARDVLTIISERFFFFAMCSTVEAKYCQILFKKIK